MDREPDEIIKIWGVIWKSYRDYGSGYCEWRTEFREPPFYFKGKYVVGIGIKSILEGRRYGVSKFVVKAGDKEATIWPPSDKDLKRKVREKMYEDKVKLDPLHPMRIFYFVIN